jgi:hypothetical protein
MSTPPSLITAPPMSLTATTRMPADVSRNASGAPTLPKPWTTARLPTIGSSSSRNAARAQVTHPVDVAPVWPREPPIDSGLPVTDAARFLPETIDSVSTSQAITRLSVLTSGAGMSVSGPSSGLIS